MAIGFTPPFSTGGFLFGQASLLCLYLFSPLFPHWFRVVILSYKPTYSMTHKRKETMTKKMSKWTDTEIDRLVSLVVAGHTIDSISAKLNRTYRSVSCKVSELRGNGIILPQLKKSTKKPRYEMDHVDSTGPLFYSEAKEVTVPLLSPVASAYASSSTKDVKVKKTSPDQEFKKIASPISMLLDSIHKKGYSATLSFKKGKLTHIVID